MANKRIYQLQDAPSVDGLYVPADKSGNAEAVRIPLGNLIPYRLDTVAVTAGSDLVEFITPYSVTTGSDYELPVLLFIDINGDKSGGIVSDKTRVGFTFTSEYGGNLTYVAMLKY